MTLLERPIAITDVETTGLDPVVHEIVEIGLIVVDQRTLQVLDSLDVKVRPEHIETATEFALKLNGYNKADWRNALPLDKAMMLYGETTRGAMFCAHNTTFDWSFIDTAFKSTGVKDQMDYHRIDLFTMAWMKLRNSGLEKFNMNEVAKYLGLGEEPIPHRAFNGVMTATKIYNYLVSGR